MKRIASWPCSFTQQLRSYKPDAWSRARHYLLVFKEDIFECIARDHRIERVDVTMHDAVAMIASRLRD